MSGSDGLVTVKVGGSLFDLPDLAARLRAWLARLSTGRVLLVPGGGPTADIVRALDRLHALGEEAAHWLAVRALTLNAYFLQNLLPEAAVVRQPHDPPRAGAALAVLDPHPFLREDEGRPGCLPHRWEVTSDALAARAAVVAGARRLVLLKSVTVPEGMGWDEAGRRGLVDGWFARVLEGAHDGLAVCAVNLREWRG
jgi:5-(aminomethyl)-3-furanmethanol phosphate kinase